MYKTFCTLIFVFWWDQAKHFVLFCKTFCTFFIKRFVLFLQNTKHKTQNKTKQNKTKQKNKTKKN